MKPTKEQLLKQLNELTELAKSKGLLKVDPVTKLSGTFVDKNDESSMKKDGGIQAGIAAAGAAGGVPHTTPAGSTMGAINAMGSAFGKSGNLDKHASKDMADKLRSIYGVKSHDEKSIAANNNPDPSMQKRGSSPDQGPGNGGLGMSKSAAKEQPINDGVSSHESPMIKNLKKDGSIQAGIAAAGAGAHPQPNAGVASALGGAFGKSSFNKCDKIKGIIGSLKKGFVLP